MCDPVTAITAIGAVASAGAGVSSAISAKKNQKKQERAAAEAERRRQELLNKAKEKDPTSVRRQNTQKAKGGQAGTMLTGPQGISSEELSLSKNTLIGG